MRKTVRRSLALQKEEFVIANTETLKPFEPSQTLVGSDATVHAALKELVQRDLRLAEKLIVVPTWELKS